MADTKISKRESSFRKANLYKDATMNALKEVTEFDSKIINSNDKYLEILKEADSIEYEILKENMAKAETEVERQAIRDRMAEMKKERYQKDTENKEFYEKQLVFYVFPSFYRKSEKRIFFISISIFHLLFTSC